MSAVFTRVRARKSVAITAKKFPKCEGTRLQCSLNVRTATRKLLEALAPELDTYSVQDGELLNPNSMDSEASHT